MAKFNKSTKIIGINAGADDSYGYKQSVSQVLESYSQNGTNVLTDIGSIIASPTAKSEFIDELTASCESDTVLTSQACVSDAWYSNYASMLEQYIDNSLSQVAMESALTGYAPIVAYNPFFIKRQWVSCVFKDILLAEVPTSPVINLAYERRYLRDNAGNEYEIPKAFFDKEITSKILAATTGLNIKETAVALPLKGVGLLNSTYVEGWTGTGDYADTREMLNPSLKIFQVMVQIGSTGTIDGKEYVTDDAPRAVPCNVTVDVTTHNFVNGKIKIPALDAEGNVVGYLEEDIVGGVDFDKGTVTVLSTGDIIKSVCFRGKVANRFNTNSMETVRKVEQIQKVMPESGPRLNTSITVEDAADALALQKIDIIADHCDIMGRTLANLEDAQIRTYLDESLEAQKAATVGPFDYGRMVEVSSFNVVPPEGYAGGVTMWMKEVREFVERTLDALRKILNTEKAVFVIYGHPNSIRYLQDGISWVFTDNTEISGIKLNYQFGVMTTPQNRIHVVSSMFVPESDGLRFLVIPTTNELVTFKQYRYSAIIDRNYRNPLHTLTPNIMVTQRTLTFDVLPVQGQLELVGRSMFAPETYKRETVGAEG